MRKLLRKVARCNMKRAGIQRINKRPLVYDHALRRMVKQPSFFAQNWREYAK